MGVHPDRRAIAKMLSRASSHKAAAELPALAESLLAGDVAHLAQFLPCERRDLSSIPPNTHTHTKR